jgi:hypothetical protein
VNWCGFQFGSVLLRVPKLGYKDGPRTVMLELFFIFFITILQKIYGPPKFLQNYTSAAVVHGVRGLTPSGSVALR